MSLRAFGSCLLLALAFVYPTYGWNTTMSLVDTSRTSIFHPHGRSVEAIVCGADSDVEDSVQSALYVFGHGFDCLAADYVWLCETPGVVSAIVVSNDITPFLPDTKDMALDQAYLTTALPLLAKNSSSVLFNRLSGKAVLGGHSMGGGTSVLAADPTYAPSASVDALALLAPGLYTLPPAYSHKGHVSAPLLVVSGAMDCGPNALTKEAMPLYSSVNSSVKALVVPKGANHCQWTTPTNGGVCTAAECHAIDRSEQHDIGRRILAAFMPAAMDHTKLDDFEQFLNEGKKAGTWDYTTMNTPNANLTNNCPCKR